MMHSSLIRRHLITHTLAILVIATLFVPNALIAADATSPSLFLRPHCEAQNPCPVYAVADPQTLRTSPLAKDGILDMDIVFSNPAQRKITRVRSWLIYNPNTLEGTNIDLGAFLAVPTPGEKDFSATEGYVKIDANAVAGQEPTAKEIVVARVRMKVKAIPPTGTDILAFHDAVTGGHTFALAKKDSSDPENILSQQPGSLILVMNTPTSSSSQSTTVSSAPASVGASSSAVSIGSTSSAPAVSSSKSSVASSSLSSAPKSSTAAMICGNGLLETGEECDDGNLVNGDGCSGSCKKEAQSSASSTVSASSAAMLQPDGSICIKNSECRSTLCSGGICRGDILKVQDGGMCQTAGQCVGGVCTSGICGVPVTSAPSQEARTPFGSLQPRSLRVTTQGSTVLLAWDPLPSSQLKAYNIYYGTTSGRYIQRRTIASGTTDYGIHALPEKVTYFFAIRALSVSDEESAFSQEVSVEVGNPKSSTAPLTGKIISDKQPTTVPGETGLSSDLLLFLLISAIAGTVLASRRQIIALRHPRA